LWLNLERTQDNLTWEDRKDGVARRRQLKKDDHFPEAMTKKGRQFFLEKIG